MSKKSASQKRAARQQQERTALGNLFNIFLLGLAAECYLFIVYQGYVNGGVNSFLMWGNILRVAVWAGLALLVGGAAVAFGKRNDPKVGKIATVTAGVGAFLAVTSWIMTRFFETGTVALCIAVPVLTVLGLVYYLYQRECFACTTLLAGALFTVWVCSKGIGGYWTTLVTVCAALVAVGLVAALVLIWLLQKNEGMLAKFRVFPTGCDYRLLYAVCAVCAVVVVLAMVMPSLSFYLTWALVIALFAELAYYTTKMM